MKKNIPNKKFFKKLTKIKKIVTNVKNEKIGFSKKQKIKTKFFFKKKKLKN